MNSPGDAIKQGIAFVSSSRQEESLGMTLTVQENLFLNPATRGRKISQPLSRREEIRQADALVREFLIRPSDPARVVSTLSGGNQQKVVLARWLDVHNKVLVMEEPGVGFFLVRLDGDGHLAGDTWHRTLAEAREQAAFEYGDTSLARGRPSLTT